jgi:hypothetical protein
MRKPITDVTAIYDESEVVPVMNTKQRPNRLLRITLTAVLILSSFSFFALPARAAEPTYEMEGAYTDSAFYDALLSYELTGDMRRDVVSVAYTQLGYHEGNGETELHGGNISGRRNYAEYNRIRGALDNGEGNGRSLGYAWCASFVSWCLRQGGVPVEVAVNEVSCQRMADWYREHATYYRRGGGYTPIPGDIVMFRYGSGGANHVGLVVGVENGRLYTIEGNTSDMVGLRSYSLSNSAILGYCVPDYTTVAGDNYDFPLTAGHEPGEYITVAAHLNVRSGPSTAYGKLGKLPAGSRVTVDEVRGEWGRITFEGRQAWISLNYTVPDPSNWR